MKKEYVVMDETGNVSYGGNNSDAPEVFKTFRAAKSRSESLAILAPGQPVKIYELTAETIVPTAKVTTSRTHPIEHYQ